MQTVESYSKDSNDNTMIVDALLLQGRPNIAENEQKIQTLKCSNCGKFSNYLKKYVALGSFAVRGVVSFLGIELYRKLLGNMGINFPPPLMMVRLFKCRCSGCASVSYCCRECQVLHWKAGHKRNCKT